MSIPGIEIDCINRDNPKKPKNAEFIEKQVEFDWVIETQQGNITFTSIGFNQYVRKKPVLASTQSFDQKERGGISFALTPDNSL